MLKRLLNKDKQAESPRGIQFEHPQSLEDLAGFLRFDGTTFIYKHSTRCSVSLFAMRRLNMVEPQENEQWIYIDVVMQRTLSMAIAEELGVHHESPQLLMLRQGKVVAHGSHQQVTEDTVENWRQLA